MKQHYFCERRQAPMGRVTCDRCKVKLCDEPYYRREESRQYEGINIGEHECSRCRQSRERAYDSYIMQRDMFGHE